jgi:hypothetical protein
VHGSHRDFIYRLELKLDGPELGAGMGRGSTLCNADRGKAHLGYFAAQNQAVNKALQVVRRGIEAAWSAEAIRWAVIDKADQVMTTHI